MFQLGELLVTFVIGENDEVFFQLILLQTKRFCSLLNHLSVWLVFSTFILLIYCLFSFCTAIVPGINECILGRCWWILNPLFESFIFRFYWNLTIFTEPRLIFFVLCWRDKYVILHVQLNIIKIILLANFSSLLDLLECWMYEGSGFSIPKLITGTW